MLKRNKEMAQRDLKQRKDIFAKSMGWKGRTHKEI